LSTAHHLTLTQDFTYPVTSALAGGTGSWNAKTYFAVGAVYGDEENLYTIGINHGTAFAVTPSADEVMVGWVAPAVLPRYYRIFYIVSPTAPDWDTDTWQVQDVIVDAYDTSVVLSAPDPTGDTYVFGSAPPSVVLNPVLDWTGDERQNLVVTANGKHRQKSWAQSTLYSQVNLELSMMSCGPQDYMVLQKWCRFAVPIKLEEPSTGFPTGAEPLYDYLRGTIVAVPQIYSWGKVNAPSWQLGIAVEREVYQ
jgi:hypothetical protein